MALAQVGGGFYFPDRGLVPNGASSSAVLDATGERFAMCGRLFIAGRPAGAKTLSSAGGGKISWRAGTCTFANGGTSLEIGIQGVSIAAGPLLQPDGTFSAKAQLTGGSGISSAAWNDTALTTGSVNLAHGDLVSVVWDMTARAGSDSVIPQVIATRFADGNLFGLSFPNTNAYLAGAWQTGFAGGSMRLAPVLITFDDGTLGWIDGAPPVSTPANGGVFSSASTPDERGWMFQLRFDCKVDGLWGFFGATDANSTMNLKLYADPLGAPSALASLAISPRWMTGSNEYLMFHALASEVSLSKNTNYAVALEATGSSNCRYKYSTLASENHRPCWDGGANSAYVSRSDGAGAFSAETPAVTVPHFGVRISSVYDTAGGGRIIGG